MITQTSWHSATQQMAHVTMCPRLTCPQVVRPSSAAVHSSAAASHAFPAAVHAFPAVHAFLAALHAIPAAVHAFPAAEHAFPAAAHALSAAVHAFSTALHAIPAAVHSFSAAAMHISCYALHTFLRAHFVTSCLLRHGYPPWTSDGSRLVCIPAWPKCCIAQQFPSRNSLWASCSKACREVLYTHKAQLTTAPNGP